MLERIKYSFIRKYIIYIRFYIRKFLPESLLPFTPFWKTINELEKNLSIGTSDKKIILYFNSSSAIDKPSLLTVAGMIIIWLCEKKGYGVETIQCVGGLEYCHLGANPFNHKTSMPCKSCTKSNGKVLHNRNPILFSNKNRVPLKEDLKKLNYKELSQFKYKGVNVGSLCLSSVIWILRTSNIENRNGELHLINAIKGSINLIEYLESISIDSIETAIVFNGLTYPEAVLREWCVNKGIRVITFESGFSLDGAPALELNHQLVSQHNFKYQQRKLNSEEDAKLAKYLENKEAGFSNDSSLHIPYGYKKIVSIFGNVSWDTSQKISSTLFSSMFDWLDLLKLYVKDNKDIFFVFRGHPGEQRRVKSTWYGLDNWYAQNQDYLGSNSICIPSRNLTNTYDLIKKSNLVLVYNSTVGIEATILGKKTMMAANTHYSNKGFVEFPKNIEEYKKRLVELLNESNTIENKTVDEAKSYLYQLFNDISFQLGDLVCVNNKDSEARLSNIELFQETLDTERWSDLVKGIVSNKSFFPGRNKF